VIENLGKFTKSKGHSQEIQSAWEELEDIIQQSKAVDIKGGAISYGTFT
jgi:hypothetical protein